jgi:cyclopropane-fatty-acyl-phospholipid synthase
MSQAEETTFESAVLDAGDDTRVGRSTAKLIRRLVGKLAYGRLRIVTPSGMSFVHEGRAEGPEATIVLRNWRALRRVLSGGDIGFAEGFIEGDWNSPDRVALIRLFARNAAAMTETIQGHPLMRTFTRIRHWMRANSKRGSRRNIEAHYDLGNAFYGLWLDAAMVYSSAIFSSRTVSLEEAQQAKLGRIRELLQLAGGERILEIGCGWGALARHLAETAQAHVTGITLSPSQLALSEEAVSTPDLAGRVDLRLQDYREVQGQFDRVVSIEMFEAVGEAYWPSYFSTLRRSLAAGGRAVLQVISIAEDRYEDYKRDTDFIQAHIFPGGFLPSKTAFAMAAEKAGLAIVYAEYFGESYAETLAEWRRRFNLNWSKIAPLGFDERFKRLWNYYLEYCEAGFREGAVDVGLYTLVPEEAAR